MVYEAGPPPRLISPLVEMLGNMLVNIALLM